MTIKGGLEPCAGEDSAGEESPSTGPATFEQTIDLDRLETWELGFDGLAWGEAVGAAAARARVVMRREGRRVTEPPPAEMDPALVEQLKALGYLDG